MTAAGTIANGSDSRVITISANGSSVYATNYGSDNISIFDRNTSTGALTAAGTIATGTSPISTTISTDGCSVYSIDSSSNIISIFERNTGSIIVGTPFAQQRTGLPSNTHILQRLRYK